MKIPKEVVVSKMCIIRVTTFQAPLQSLCVWVCVCVCVSFKQTQLKKYL